MFWICNNYNNNDHIECSAEVYKIPCVDCNKNMLVKLAQLIHEHKRDLKRANINKNLF